MCAKTFGQEIKVYTELAEAVACYVARAAEKLRSQDSQAALLTVFVRTNHFNKTVPHYENSYSICLPFPTAFTPDLIKSALRGLKAIFQEGFNYKKAGVMLSKITPLAHVQPDLFGDVFLCDHYRKAKLMAVVDAINTIYGRDSLNSQDALPRSGVKYSLFYNSSMVQIGTPLWRPLSSEQGRKQRLQQERFPLFETPKRRPT